MVAPRLHPCLHARCCENFTFWFFAFEWAGDFLSPNTDSLILPYQWRNLLMHQGASVWFSWTQAQGSVQGCVDQSPCVASSVLGIHGPRKLLLRALFPHRWCSPLMTSSYWPWLRMAACSPGGSSIRMAGESNERGRWALLKRCSWLKQTWKRR